MKAISPVIATLILIAIAVIAGVFVLRQFLLLSTTSGQQNMIQIQDAVLYRVLKTNPTRMEVTLQISIKNIGQRVVTVKNITVDGLPAEGFTAVTLNPGDVFTSTYTILKLNTYSDKWDTGTEHTLVVTYQVLGNPNTQEVSTKVSVQ